FTDYSTHSGNPWIPLGSPAWLPIRFSIRPHAPELEDRKYTPITAHSLLVIKDRTRAFEDDQASRQRLDRQRKSQDRQTDGDIECALQHRIEHAVPETVGIQQPTRSQRLQVDRARFTFPEIEELRYLETGDFAVEELSHRQAPAFAGCYHDLTDPKRVR